jgi:hypothetical protein
MNNEQDTMHEEHHNKDGRTESEGFWETHYRNHAARCARWCGSNAGAQSLGA